ncbi:MAG TPA: hypothetical protein VLJ41_15045 [Segetibacter sp.]|nr:hypothetical protein [Segetibacter sp.]
MKNIKAIMIANLLVLFFSLGCYPNGDKNSTDVKNSDKEGAIDSTRITDFDTVNPPFDSNTSVFH